MLELVGKRYVKIVYDVILKGHVKFKQYRTIFTTKEV